MMHYFSSPFTHSDCPCHPVSIPMYLRLLAGGVKNFQTRKNINSKLLNFDKIFNIFQTFLSTNITPSSN